MSLRMPLAALLLSLTAAGQAGDFDAEKFLTERCSQCHDSSVYTRPDHKVQSLQGLEDQVRRCDGMIGTKLFDDEIRTLVDHLNQRYYHF